MLSFALIAVNANSLLKDNLLLWRFGPILWKLHHSLLPKWSSTSKWRHLGRILNSVDLWNKGSLLGSLIEVVYLSLKFPSRFLQRGILGIDGVFLLLLVDRVHSYVSKCMFFLLRMFRVLNLSFKSNQKKILCFGWKIVFHSHLKTGWTWCCPINLL